MSFHAGQTFVFGETPSATKWQYIWDNDYALADGTGIEDEAIQDRHVQDANIPVAKLVSAARWWEVLGTTTLGSAGDSISVSIAARKYLKVLVDVDAVGSINLRFRFNTDSGNNYALRISTDGAADTTGVSDNNISTKPTAGTDHALVGYIANLAAQEKLFIFEGVGSNSAGAANAPTRRQGVAKWANTSNQITGVEVYHDSSGDFGAGSSLTIWGHD